MLEAYVGEDDFRTGVRNYLNAHRYGNAARKICGRAVQAASGQPVLDIARSFTGQPGFPLLSASSDVVPPRRADECHDHTAALRAWTTRRAPMNVGAIPVVTLAFRRWHAGADAAGAQTAMARVDRRAAPIIVNAGQSGFFRVKYDAANFRSADPTLQRNWSASISSACCSIITPSAAAAMRRSRTILTSSTSLPCRRRSGRLSWTMPLRCRRFTTTHEAERRSGGARLWAARAASR